MPAWISPFPLEPAFEQRLNRCGWTAWSGDLEDLPPDGAALYGAPDQLLANHAADLTIAAIQKGYRDLLATADSHRLINAWRLLGCSEDALHATLNMGEPLQGWPSSEPLGTLITRAMLDSHPTVLDGYLDLELKSDLLGGEPDTRYRKRLQSELDLNEVLRAWRLISTLKGQLDQTHENLHLNEQQLQRMHDECKKLSKQQEDLIGERDQLVMAMAEREQSHHQLREDLKQQLSDSRQEQQLTLSDLHQVQEDLQQQLLHCQEQAAEFELLRQKQLELTAERDQFKNLLAEQNQQLSDSRQEQQLTLQQLQLTQEELEHFFLVTRSQAGHLQRYEELLKRGENLLLTAVPA